jgi:hypothetical protein
LRPAKGEQHLAASGFVVVEQRRRLRVVRDGLLVGEQLRRTIAGGDGVPPCRARTGEVACEQEVVSQLGRIDVRAAGQPLQRVGDAVMQPDPAADAERAVEGLAHERV